MSEKQSEAFDEWFKDAADGYEPPFNEEAWNKMEAKLDGQAKRRRRPLAWWWWLTDALVVGLVLYMAFGPNVRIKKENGTAENVSNILPQNAKEQSKTTDTYQTEKPPAVHEKKDSVKRTAVPTATNNDADITASIKNDGSKNNSLKPLIPNEKTKKYKEGFVPTNSVSHKGNNGNENTLATAAASKKNTVEKSKNTLPKNKHTTGGSTVDILPNDKENGFLSSKKISNAIDSEVKNSVGKDVVIDNSLNKKIITSDELVNAGLQPYLDTAGKAIGTVVSANKIIAESVLAKDSAETLVALKKQAVEDSLSLVKALNKRAKDKMQLVKGRFFVYGAVSPEWSFIFGNKTGKATMAYGAGIGYNFGKRWSVLAGFNSTKKLYTAGKGDYKIVKGSYWDNPNIAITSIEANCNVYEIPVSVRYTIQQGKRHSVYGSLGIATAIMKKEVYDYDYTRNGWANYYSRTYTTGKTQFLSGALISIGYARKLGNSFSVMAEPYFKMPLQGVGEGKVKIGSVGVSVGVQYTLPGF